MYFYFLHLLVKNSRDIEPRIDREDISNNHHQLVLLLLLLLLLLLTVSCVDSFMSVVNAMHVNEV